VVATFDHRRNAAGEPHIHSHAVIVNLVASPYGWRCLASGPQLWATERAAAARYFVSLDAYLRANGLNLDWDHTPSGSREVAGVPRAAVVAASSRRAQIMAAAPDHASREIARRDTHDRRPDAPWPAAVAAAGFGRREATAVLDGASARPAPDPSPQLNWAAVETELLERGSLFRKETAMEVVATYAPAGSTLDMVDQWTARLCERARALPGRHFLSPNAEQADEQVAAAALKRQGVGVGVALTTEAMAQRTVALDPTGRLALARLVREGNGVDVLAPGPGRAGEPPILAQGALIDAARVAWQAAGHEVAVAPGPKAEAQWRALTALQPPHPDGPTPTVLVVDCADRLATPELGELLAAARRDATKVVLVVGGTQAARSQPRSGALARIIDSCVPVIPGLPPALETMRHPAWAVDGDRLVTLSGHDALGHLFSAWVARQPDASTMMLGSGRTDVAALNDAARRHLAATGVLRGPERTVAGLVLREGERVLTLARGAGALGTVLALDRGSVAVRWDSGLESTLDRRRVRDLGYGYATTPALLRPGRAGPAVLLGLGGREVLGADARLAATWEVAPTQPRFLTRARDRWWGAARHLEPEAVNPLPLDRPDWQLERELSSLRAQLLADPVPSGEAVAVWARAHGPELDRWAELETAIGALGDLRRAGPGVDALRAKELGHGEELSVDFGGVR
jgi:hypothetical protein